MREDFRQLWINLREGDSDTYLLATSILLGLVGLVAL